MHAHRTYLPSAKEPSRWGNKKTWPTFVTLTGADDFTEIGELFELSRQFDYVEWGILWHAERHGSGRYPSLAWIDRIAGTFSRYPNAHFALHICGGQALSDFLSDIGTVTECARNFGRIQLNLKAANVDLTALVSAVLRRPEQVVITQHNMSNPDLWKVLGNCANHAVLFDESGGNSISPVSWPAPMPGKHCGYAGGLGPRNLRLELERIESAAQGQPFWIDMEGNLRSSDRFDLQLARSCLECVDQWRMANGLDH